MASATAIEASALVAAVRASSPSNISVGDTTTAVTAASYVSTITAAGHNNNDSVVHDQEQQGLTLMAHHRHHEQYKNVNNHTNSLATRTIPSQDTSQDNVITSYTTTTISGEEGNSNGGDAVATPSAVTDTIETNEDH
eukprot:CAMPEP_0194420702 /NCGR_PEP_ID=MMETSP0176-20130528/19998_1 /TAXON_ID=216777 /ORGANISM="Proboscia alata, Strain PI-D3" /LENGTH=137 /DNA_ID=CAMNT_0039228471 /DNA_START=133 /DNA_END=543 /DNA_ORIENTATION=+